MYIFHKKSKMQDTNLLKVSSKWYGNKSLRSWEIQEMQTNSEEDLLFYRSGQYTILAVIILTFRVLILVMLR